MRLPTVIFSFLVLLALACGSADRAAPAPTRARNTPAPDQPAATEAAPPTEAPTEAAPVAAVYRTGQDVQVGDVRWKITEAKDLGQALKSDNEFIEDKTTKGRFISVAFEMENLATEQKSFTGLSLVDGKGRKFEASSDAFMFIEQEKQCIFENLNPNVTKECRVIFEVPADATGLNANVGDLELFGGDEALIELGF